MLLRRVIEHVKAQNWTAVALDFVIVVVGVFIGIQVSNWNDARAERMSERRYLVELQRDLEADISAMERGFGSTRTRLATSELILAAVDPDYERAAFLGDVEGEVVLPERFENYIYAAFANTSYLVGKNHTFDELVQTGNLGVLSDRALVKTLTEYYSNFEGGMLDDEIIRRHLDRTLDYLTEQGLGLGDKATIDDAVALARSDARFLGLVKAANFFSIWQLNRTRALKNDASAALADVTANLEGR